MRNMIRSCVLIAAIAMIGGLAGCSMMPHFMQPHQLQKLNRGIDGTPSSGYNGVRHGPISTGHFASIEDIEPQLAANAQSTAK